MRRFLGLVQVASRVASAMHSEIRVLGSCEGKGRDLSGNRRHRILQLMCCGAGADEDPFDKRTVWSRT